MEEAMSEKNATSSTEKAEDGGKKKEEPSAKLVVDAEALKAGDGYMHTLRNSNRKLT
jgi:hypothetical protein